MHFLLLLSDQAVSAFQYFLDTLFGGIMLFVFAQVPRTRRNALSMLLLVLCSFGLVLTTIVTTDWANIGILYALFVHLPFILWFRFIFHIRTSIVFISHFLTYNILSSRVFFGNLSLLLMQYLLPRINSAIAARIGWILSGPVVVFAALYLLAHRFPVLALQGRAERRLLLGAMGGAYAAIQLTHLSSLVGKKYDPLLLSLVFSILLFSFVISICMYSSIAKEAEAVRSRNTAYAIQTEGLSLLTDAMASYLQNTARLRHDHRHFLTLIDLHSRNGDLEAIKGLVKTNLDVFDSSPTRVTGDDILDGIITLFRRRADPYSIPIDIIGMSLLDLPVSRDDLCLLLSNCLENAIEAARHVPKEERRITVSVSGNKDTGTVALLVRNPVRGPVEFDRTGVPLSRRGEAHGIGTRSMKMIVQKYNGLCSFSVDNGHFHFRAAFFAEYRNHSQHARFKQLPLRQTTGTGVG